MQILVLNAGSSSLKLDLFSSDPSHGRPGAPLLRLLQARAERIGRPEAAYTVCGRDGAPLAEHAAALPGADHAAVLARLLPVLCGLAGEIGAVGHRVAHGGDRFAAPARIDDAVEAEIDALSRLAPLHNPPALAGIRAARALLPAALHIAVFDTAFHATLPRRATAVPLPPELVAAHGLRRYGFHGTSHAYVAARAAAFLRADVRDLRIVTCHLGSGASTCAVEYGRSVETSMGMTPLQGLVMGTRPGDLDPGILLHLQRAGLSADDLDRLLNQEGGLKGLCGSNDMRDIEARAAAGDERAMLAIHVFTHRLRAHIGAAAALMGGLDAIVFTGGIGENSALCRHRAAQRLEFLGARLDEDRNRLARIRPRAGDEPGTPDVADLSQDGSRVRILSVISDEARAIAEAAAALSATADRVGPGAIPIAVSARHVHLTPEAVGILFGPGHRLTPLRDLSQPGQFACAEQVTVVGPRNRIEGVRVLGPERRACQVEVSRTDEFFLGVDAPVRDSGDVKNSTGCTLEGPAGSLALREGLICARRHIHMHPDDARAFGVSDRDVVEVAIDSADRDLIFGDVLIRVHPEFRLEMHVDTDEANAAELSKGATGVLDRTGGAARLLRRKTAFDPAAPTDRL